ncbi:MAG: type II toxin-antitoxin system prevent-host-death family antitoxin [Mariprofundus sp.]|nr:type II toxin-antitoxin system prevent-host-death family antitoxin [Mariprofundus sp.]
MIREASAMTVRNNLGELLNEVVYRHDSIVIQKSGKSVAAIVDIKLFDKIRLMQGEFDALCDRLAANAKNGDPDELQSDLQEAMSAVRVQKYRSQS